MERASQTQFLGDRVRLACLAVGVSAVVAVAGISASLDQGIRREARQLLAADLAIRGSQPIPPGVNKALAQVAGLQRTDWAVFDGTQAEIESLVVRTALRGSDEFVALGLADEAEWMVRQAAGDDNSLGLVKFMFPNSYSIYLHSTPTVWLFQKTRRDFSHGCIRLEKPAELAAWLLQDQPQWTLDAVRAAMQSGPDNQQVNLMPPVPVVIIYLTAVVEEDGEVYFFDDIYGRDRDLNAVLAKGPPYP